MAQTKGKGFFAKDEDFGTRLDEWVERGEQFLAMEVEQDTPFHNPALPEGHKDKVISSRTKITARKIDPDTLKPYGLPVVVKTLGQVIYDHAGEQAPGDFPAVVCWELVDVKQYGNQAMILRKVCSWPIPDDLRAMMKGDEA